MTLDSQSSDQKPDRTRGAFRVFADLSLRVKLIFVFLVVTLLAVGIIAFLNIGSTNDALTTQVSEGLAGLAASEAHNIAVVLGERVEAMQAFTPDPEAQAAIAAQNATYSGGTEAILAELTKLDEQWVAAGDDDPLIQERVADEQAEELDEETLANELLEITQIIPDFAEAFVTDRYGGLVAASDRTSDYYQADEGWWQAAYNEGQGAVYIGEPELDESTGVIGVNIAVPVYDRSNKLVGILRTTLDATALVGRLAALELGETGRADLLVGEGVFEARDEGYEGEDQNAIDPVALAQIVATSEGYVETNFGGQPALIGFAAVSSPAGKQFISDLGWKVIVHQDQDEALAVVAAQTRNTGLMTLIIATIVVVVAVGMGQVLANPIAQLTGVVTRFTEGDLSARSNIDSGDETGMLAASFNQMAEQVGGLLTTIQARSAELEERTREMEASQRVTFAASERTTPDALLDLVVNLIRDQFHLYHVQVYLVDEEQQAAVLRKSTGYAGRRLLQSQHQIPLDRPALVTQAIHEGQPALVADVSQDPNFMPNPLLPHTRSELAVPLRLGPNVIGVLDAQDRQAGRFSESTVALFQTMANQIAFLFENSDLLDNVTEQSETLTIFASQLRTAADIARQLGTVLDPDRLLQQVVDMMQSRFGLYHAHIYVLEASLTGGNGQGSERTYLTVRAGSGEVGRVLRERGHSIPLDSPKSLVARAARTQEMVVVDDTSLVPDFMPNPLLPQTNSELAVPLVFGDQVLGVLDMQDDQAGRFTQTELDTFTTLAGQIATALQTAGLFAQVQARFLVSQALTGTQTEDDVLNAMVEAASSYPEARISIYTIDQDTPADNGQGVTTIVRRDESFDSGILSELPTGTRFTAAQFPLLQHISAGEPFISPNLPLDERADPLSQEMATSQDVVSMALLPIMAGDEWLGVITASSRREGYFDERKLHLYRSLAEQGAMALRTGQLFDETQRTAERLREVDRIKGEFLASMSHELRTPLNSILGYTEVMLMGIDGDLDPETQEDVQAIYDNGQHLLSLINDVLDVAKIEAGYLKLNIEELQIETLIETAQNNAAGLLTNKPGVEFVVEAEGAEAFPSIQGDQIRLTQILNNLISNAIKFTDEGRVTLRAYRDHPDWICLEVEDSGIGINQEDLDKIFDRFHQVDSSESRRAGGTGLGLPITRHLIELHGGTVEVRSQLGQGSTFTVRLPVQAQEESGT